MRTIRSGCASAAACLLTLAGAASGQAFHEAVGTDEYEQAFAVTQTSDGGYATAGYIYDFTSFLPDFYIVRFDSSGNPLWHVRYGSPNADDQAFSIQQTSDGGFVVAGSTNVFGDALNVAVVRLDAAGALVWARTYEGDWWYEDATIGVSGAQGIQIAADQSIFIVGRKTLEASGLQGGQLLRIDSAGTPIFNKVYLAPVGAGLPSPVTFNDIAALGPGAGLAVVGTKLEQDQLGNQLARILIARLQGNGTVTAAKEYSTGPTTDPYSAQGHGIDRAQFGLPVSDIVVDGRTSFGSTGFQPSGVEFLRVDANLNLLSARTYAYPNFGQNFEPGSAAVREVRSTGDIMLGGSYYFGDGGSTAWGALVSSMGDPYWFMAYGGGAYTRGEGVFTSADDPPKHVGLTGGVFSGADNLGLQDVYLLRAVMNGKTCCNEERFEPVVDEPPVAPADVVFTVTNLQGFEVFPGDYSKKLPAQYVYCSGKLCEADINCDGIMDLSDFFDFFNFFDTSDPSADLNNDGVVDLSDFFLFFGEFDTSCA